MQLDVKVAKTVALGPRKNQTDIKHLGVEGPRLCVADGSPKKKQRLQLTDKESHIFHSHKHGQH